MDVLREAQTRVDGDTVSACIGFGEREGTCDNEAGTPWTPLWCHECDEKRRAHITDQMERISASFACTLVPAPAEPPERTT